MSKHAFKFMEIFTILEEGFPLSKIQFTKQQKKKIMDEFVFKLKVFQFFLVATQLEYLLRNHWNVMQPSLWLEFYL